ncbi:hypothetical protein K2173_024474 [Erythroxylum novogranatense]|uniref:Nitrate regulatory gene2 protein-like n=1 Tax=Erythroxylum novogranatense TaxID=1862640 RepID=A0AAV8SV85_9ROSI|nr:hypothetical protein K2173_024474 [Erythroxylum novogranatense]
MGCTQSKIENEEAVARCKDRKLFMKEAVAARNAFAAGHSSYAMSLKYTGAALSDYAQNEVPHHHHLSSSSAPAAESTNLQPPSAARVATHAPTQDALDELKPPPPFPLNSLQRAATMPEIKIQKLQEARKPAGPTIVEEEDGVELELHDNERLVRKRSNNSDKSNRGEKGQQRKRDDGDVAAMTNPPAQMMHQDMHQDSTWDYFFPPPDSIPGPTLTPVEEEEEVNKATAEAEKAKRTQEKVVEEDDEVVTRPPVVVEEESLEVQVPVVSEKKLVTRMGGEGGGRRMGNGVNLIKLFSDFDDHFLKASESAHDVSKMLEATRLHYHSNYADNRGHIDHSARVMRVITWNRSFKGIPNIDEGKDEFDSEEHETHATVLDKMLAWEKKLYDEVKAGEIMKYEYQKKVTSLNKQKRGTNSDSLEKLKAAVSHLHTRYIVDMQSMDSTVSEINRLRDERLYPKLLQLVDGMATMWETMRSHHEAQFKIANALRAVDILPSPKESTEHLHHCTYQLVGIVEDWHVHFCQFVDHQKQYIKALKNWLKLNLVPIESSLKEKVSSPPRVQKPPIQELLFAWDDYLDKLPDEVARSAIKNFAAVVHTIFQHQEEELKLKKKCEETREELSQKTRKFEDWYSKYMQTRTPDELDPDMAEGKTYKDAIAERQFVVDAMKKRLEDEEEAYQKHCLQVREKSLVSLKTRLPELFRAMSDIAAHFSHLYKTLRSTSQRRNPNSS